MNKNLIIITTLSLCLIIFGIFMTTFGIMKVSNITVERDFSSNILNEDFTLTIYTPPAYSLKFNQSYPVLYILDGEKYFKERKEARRTEWSMQKILDRLIKEEQLQDLIVVGIYSTPNRINNYTPTMDAKYNQGGNLQGYADFITEELKPYIEQRYRTKIGAEHTGIAGSSLGGLASLHIAWDHPEVFSKIGAISPYLWWDNYEFRATLQNDIEEKRDLKLWLDGEPSTDPLDPPISAEQLTLDVEDLKEYLVTKGGYSEQDIYLHQQGKMENVEVDLDKRLESLLLYLFAK